MHHRESSPGTWIRDCPTRYCIVGVGILVPVSDHDSTADLVLDEIHLVFASQQASFQSLSGRAATILSVLTGFVTAALAIEAAVARPPFWALAVPSLLVLVGLLFTVQAFSPGAVWLGPQPESLRLNLDEPSTELQRGLIDFYTDIIATNRKSLERRARDVKVATWFLVAATAALLLAGLTLYL
jgi:hypothetical protein